MSHTAVIVLFVAPQTRFHFAASLLPRNISQRTRFVLKLLKKFDASRKPAMEKLNKTYSSRVQADWINFNRIWINSKQQTLLLTKTVHVRHIQAKWGKKCEATKCKGVKKNIKISFLYIYFHDSEKKKHCSISVSDWWQFYSFSINGRTSDICVAVARALLHFSIEKCYIFMECAGDPE